MRFKSFSIGKKGHVNFSVAMLHWAIFGLEDLSNFGIYVFQDFSWAVASLHQDFR